MSFTLIVAILLHGCTQIFHAQTVDYRENLHLFMTQDQLWKYFGVNNHEEVPKYEVVNVSMKKRGVAKRRPGNDKMHQGAFTSASELLLTSQSIFGQHVQMALYPNPYLLPPTVKMVKIDENGQEDHLPSRYQSSSFICHYLGTNGNQSAAVSKCDFKENPGLSGILLLPIGGVNIRPVGDNLTDLLKASGDQNPEDNQETVENLPHIVSMPRRTKKLSVVDEREDEHYIPANPREEYELDDTDIFSHFGSDFDDGNFISDTPEEDSGGKILKEELNKRASSDDHYLELGVFFDQAAYELFMPHVGSEEKLVDLILGFVNQMQAVYQQSSLKNKVQISIVHLEVMKKQPKDLPHADGERDKLLDAFCSYQAKKNPASDKDPNHWDLALYISGLNFFSMENGKKNGVTMGLAPVGGVCIKQHACVIAEFGTVSDDGKPYPSAGLLSTYVAVHEIGHNGSDFYSQKRRKSFYWFLTMVEDPCDIMWIKNSCDPQLYMVHFLSWGDDRLGMYHDGPPNNKCPTNGHVMSPSRGTKGETTWSSCSADVLQKMNKDCLQDKPKSVSKDRDHSKFKQHPGQTWDAHDQCKLFLRDEDASLLNDTVITLQADDETAIMHYYDENFRMVCEQTLCKTPHRIGYYAAGPALEGTYCGGKKWCQQGECISWGSANLKVIKGGWSQWSNGKCQSGCIEKAKGTQTDKRFCNDPKPQNTEKTCDGDNIRINFCDDNKLCKDRTTPVSFANERCKVFSKYLSDVTPVGVQVKYNEKRQWQSCAVYCKMKSGTWYTPRQELNDRGIDTFFPEGTWCHNNGKVDYYCQNRLCLPPSRKGRSMLTHDFLSRGRNPEVDVPMLNNADPKGQQGAPEKLKEYFEYIEGKNPSPLPLPEDLRRPRDEDYWIVDY